MSSLELVGAVATDESSLIGLLASLLQNQLGALRSEPVTPWNSLFKMGGGGDAGSLCPESEGY